MASICPSTSMSVVSMYKDGLVESTHLGENSAGLAIAAVIILGGVFLVKRIRENVNTVSMVEEEIFLLQLLFSFPYFSFHNSESFPVHLAKIIQGMTGKFKMSRAVLEIQFSDWEKGRNLFS